VRKGWGKISGFQTPQKRKKKKTLMELACGTFPGNTLYKEV